MSVILSSQLAFCNCRCAAASPPICHHNLFTLFSAGKQLSPAVFSCLSKRRQEKQTQKTVGFAKCNLPQWLRPQSHSANAVKLTGVDSEGYGLLGQNGPCCQVLHVAGVVVPAVLTRQMGKVQVAVLSHHHALAELDVVQPCREAEAVEAAMEEEEEGQIERQRGN